MSLISALISDTLVILTEAVWLDAANTFVDPISYGLWGTGAVKFIISDIVPLELTWYTVKFSFEVNELFCTHV